MFTTLGRLTVRHRRAVLVVTFLALVAAAVLGTGVFSRLSSGGFDDPGSESTRATEALADEFGTGSPDLVLVVTATDPAEGTIAVDAPDVAAAGLALTSELAAIDGTDDVVSYWSLGSPPPLRSDDGSRALVLLRVPGDEDDPARADLIGEIIETYDTELSGTELSDTELADTELAGTDVGPISVAVGGPERVFEQIGATIEGDLARAEAIAIPLTLALLVVVFAGIVAALSPSWSVWSPCSVRSSPCS